ncbi:MAG TPA: CcdB family protein [Acetobacteraceae bacterium]|nr:CcdB family protein [Acetobacteraceae bacterium]
MDVQASMLDRLTTRVVLPLVPQTQAPPPIRELNPIFEIDGTPHVLLTQAIAAVPAKELKRAVASLDGQHDQIIRALDVLLLGF